jgi:hypothetical protein
MRELASFHAAQRGDTSSVYGNCGCGCSECGEYAGDNRFDRFPDWYYDKEPHLLVAGACPDYAKAAKKYKELRRKYNTYPRINFPSWLGSKSADPKKKLRQQAADQESIGKEAKVLCEAGEKAAEKGLSVPGGGAAPTSSASDEAFNAALQQVAAGSGGSTSEGGGIDTKTLLIIGGVAVVGLGALFVLRKKPAPKRKAAPSVLPGVV